MQNWQIKKLGEICTISIGKTPSRANNKFWDVGKERNNIWLSIRDLNSTVGKKIFDSREYISNSGADLFKIVPKGTLLVSFKLTLGRLAFAGTDLYTNEAIAALEIKNDEEIDKQYLYYYLSFFDWDAETKGDTKVKGKTLNKAKLKAISVVLPPLPEQKRLVSLLDELFEKLEKGKENAEKNLKNVKELFEAYFENLFSKAKDDWEEKSFGDKELLQIVDGDRGKNYPKKSDFLEDGYCLFMNTKNVRQDGFDFNQTMFITKQKDEVLGKGRLERSDVVLTTRGTVGNIGFYSNDVPYNAIRINSGMLIFRTNKDLLLPEYLFELLRSGFIKSQIEKHVSGAAQPQLPIKTLVNFRLPLPKSLNQQREIVEKIRVFNSETKKLEKIYKKKVTHFDELKQSILHQAFTGKL